jgi:hypothetical protein
MSRLAQKGEKTNAVETGTATRTRISQRAQVLAEDREMCREPDGSPLLLPHRQRGERQSRWTLSVLPSATLSNTPASTERKENETRRNNNDDRHDHGSYPGG